MKKKELQELAQKIQIELEEQELTEYLEYFQQLEKQLTEFKKTKIKKKTILITTSNIIHLTLSDLRKLIKKYSSSKISKKTLQNNSQITKENFVLFKKTS